MLKDNPDPQEKKKLLEYNRKLTLALVRHLVGFLDLRHCYVETNQTAGTIARPVLTIKETLPENDILFERNSNTRNTTVFSDLDPETMTRLNGLDPLKETEKRHEIRKTGTILRIYCSFGVRSILIRHHDDVIEFRLELGKLSYRYDTWESDIDLGIESGEPTGRSAEIIDEAFRFVSEWNGKLPTPYSITRQTLSQDPASFMHEIGRRLDAVISGEDRFPVQTLSAIRDAIQASERVNDSVSMNA